MFAGFSFLWIAKRSCIINLSCACIVLKWLSPFSYSENLPALKCPRFLLLQREESCLFYVDFKWYKSFHEFLDVNISFETINRKVAYLELWLPDKPNICWYLFQKQKGCQQTVLHITTADRKSSSFVWISKFSCGLCNWNQFLWTSAKRHTRPRTRYHFCCREQ